MQLDIPGIVHKQKIISVVPIRKLAYMLTDTVLSKPIATNLVRCAMICRVAWEYGIKQDCYRIEHQMGQQSDW